MRDLLDNDVMNVFASRTLEGDIDTAAAGARTARDHPQHPGFRSHRSLTGQSPGILTTARGTGEQCQYLGIGGRFSTAKPSSGPKMQTQDP